MNPRKRGAASSRLVSPGSVRSEERMIAAQEKFLRQLDAAYRLNYDPVPIGPQAGALAAQYVYKRTDQAYVLSRKATIWSAETHEHVFVFAADELTAELWRECRERALELGLGLIRPHSEHKCSFVTALVVCGAARDEAIAQIVRERYRKDYRFGFYGWMEFRAAAVCLGDGRVAVSRAGDDLRPFLEKNLNLITTKES